VFVSKAGLKSPQPRHRASRLKRICCSKGDVDVPADRRPPARSVAHRDDNPSSPRVGKPHLGTAFLGRGIVDRSTTPRFEPAFECRRCSMRCRPSFEERLQRKWAVRTIMKSRTYQLSSRKNQFNGNDEIYFSHANTRLLSAEQLLDSICQVTSVPENFPGAPLGTRAVELTEPPADNYFLKIFGQPQREMACQCERSNVSELAMDQQARDHLQGLRHVRPSTLALAGHFPLRLPKIFKK